MPAASSVSFELLLGVITTVVIICGAVASAVLYEVLRSVGVACSRYRRSRHAGV